MKLKIKFYIIALTSGIFCTSQVFAAEDTHLLKENNIQEGIQSMQQKQSHSASFSNMDKDKNGFLSKAEFDIMKSKHKFTDIDKNHDGKISLEEFNSKISAKPKSK